MRRPGQHEMLKLFRRPDRISDADAVAQKRGIPQFLRGTGSARDADDFRKAGRFRNHQAINASASGASATSSICRAAFRNDPASDRDPVERCVEPG